MSKYLTIHHFNANCYFCGNVETFDDQDMAVAHLDSDLYCPGAVVVVSAYLVPNPDGSVTSYSPEEWEKLNDEQS